MKDQCYYCKQTFTDIDDLRPYGPDGAQVCYDCAMATPEREAEAECRLQRVLDKAFESGGPIVIGGGLPRAIGRG